MSLALLNPEEQLRSETHVCPEECGHGVVGDVPTTEAAKQVLGEGWSAAEFETDEGMFACAKARGGRCLFMVRR